MIAPLVSVIIPVFNDIAGIHCCLAMLRDQTYPLSRLQVIVVDNGSIPPVSLVETFPFAIQVERCLTPGSYAARNAGTRVANGDIFAFTDADCLPDSNWIAQGVEALRIGKSEYVVGGDVQIIEPQIRSGTALYQYLTGFQQRENVDINAFAVTANLFCMAGQFQAVGPFNERLFSGGDREWSWRAGRHGLTIRYEPGAIVRTPPRMSLRSAMRQACRVAAGRVSLDANDISPKGSDGTGRRRSSLESLKWIWKRPELSLKERFTVIAAAGAIKGAAAVESIRVRLGGHAKR